MQCRTWMCFSSSLDHHHYNAVCLSLSLICSLLLLGNKSLQCFPEDLGLLIRYSQGHWFSDGVVFIIRFLIICVAKELNLQSLSDQRHIQRSRSYLDTVMRWRGVCSISQHPLIVSLCLYEEIRILYSGLHWNLLLSDNVLECNKCMQCNIPRF